MREDTGTIIRNQEYCKLLDEFYQEHKSIVSEEDYERAKKDPQYFKSLIGKVTKLYQNIGKELLSKDRNYHVWEKQSKQRQKGGD